MAAIGGAFALIASPFYCQLFNIDWKRGRISARFPVSRGLHVAGFA